MISSILSNQIERLVSDGELFFSMGEYDVIFVFFNPETNLIDWSVRKSPCAVPALRFNDGYRFLCSFSSAFVYDDVVYYIDAFSRR